MKYAIYKFDFSAGVHFGTGMLNDTVYTFQADMLFSALYIEALKLGKADQFYEWTYSGKLLFSDSFPFVGDTYMLPKPMLYVETVNRGDSEEKKYYKNLKFLPVEQMEDFLKGKLNRHEDLMKEFGRFQYQTMAIVRQSEETTPFFVGTYYYSSGNGVYIIVRYEDEVQKQLMEELLEALSYTGIGGKKSSGLGKFTLMPGRQIETLCEYLQKKSERYMLLSVALPRDNELENALDGASYLLSKRSGFITSDHYAEEFRKKRDLYVFSAGSCFKNTFEGDIYDVSKGGRHSVFRYARSLFMGV
ncbi:MAG: type III-A CRISPR-associated RAMP protein Csm4 [Lachnospiraceae bacterium]|nr:type III-A CRISPR-associated RAMP protein Csm4 [Lachnospiraceae bacterium]